MVKNYNPVWEKYGVAITFIIAFLLIWLRRPDLLTNAQFWAEDGRVWYAGVYNGSIIDFILTPKNGYYQTISKLTAAVSLAIPIELAPLLFNIVAISIRAMAISFLLSSRMSDISFSGRLCVSLFAILMPEITEIHANITNTHWYLALYLLLILIARPAKSAAGKAHDIVMTIIAGLSGPFVVFMAPVVLMKLIHNKALQFRRIDISKVDLISYIVAACSVIQAVSILLTADGTRTKAPLGASMDTLSSILSSRIFFSSFSTARDASWLWNYPFFKYLVCFIGFTAIVYTLIKSDWKMRSVVIFPAIMFAFALAKPQMANIEDQWPKFMLSGERYTVIPSIAMFAVICYCIGQIKGYIGKAVTICFTILYLYTAVDNFKIRKMPDLNWGNEVVKLHSAKKGEEVKMKINPVGWDMVLIKK
ncbi:glucosyl transferase [Enterobacter sp. I4]|uniref:glucosyl transferase n=1 Tax=Enterobacter sp. I4 TaxID=2926672 RepID=UPI001F56F2AF|nr:glucosyl transferase [Enterobacter sp. I4]MCI2291014.1 glucosyl transferase [Enterobacter sp. I4]